MLLPVSLTILVLTTGCIAGSSDEDTNVHGCHALPDPHLDACVLKFERDLNNRREDDPSQFDCCIISRFDSCMRRNLPSSYSHDVKKCIKTTMKEAKVSVDCQRINYPSIYCYAYFYRDFIGLVILTMLMTFTCYIIMVCCRSCYNRVNGMKPPRVIIAMKPVTRMEKRPLIVVTQPY